jgi:hypothetical protein
MGWTERKPIIDQIEQALHSRVICYLTSDRPNAEAAVNKDVLPLFYDHLKSLPQDTKRIDLFLYTIGGDTLAAFGIARLLREFSDSIGVLIPLRCHSAGSLIALGANSIVMGKGATLSPIDPSIMGPLNPVAEPAPGQRQVVPLSVESVAGYRDLVTQDWDIKGEEALTAAFRVLADRVHPLALGNVYRARQQIEELARNLLSEHRHDDDNVTRIVKTLTRGLGSHDYPLSRRQARELFGPQLTVPDERLENLMWQLYGDFATEMEMRSPFDPNLLLRGQAAATTVQRLAIIETTAARDVAERELSLRRVQVQIPLQVGPHGPIPITPGLAVQMEVVRAGWSHYA